MGALKWGSLSRRKFLGTANASGLAAAGGSSLLVRAAAAPAKRPNILFILADDLGYGDLSIYERTKYQTPNLDRLARQGTRFTDSYAN